MMNREEKIAFIAANYDTKLSAELRKVLKVKTHKEYSALVDTAAKRGLIKPKTGSPRTKILISLDNAKAYLLKHYATESRDVTLGKKVMGPTMYYTAINELLAEGAVQKVSMRDRKKQQYDRARSAKKKCSINLISMPWVDPKWVNNSAVWHGPFGS